MNKRLPYHRHLSWLLLEGMSPEDIRAYYGNIQMAPPTREHIAAAEESIAKLMLPPITKRRLFKMLYHEDDLKVWNKLGYGEIYQHRFQKGDWSEMGRMLNHPVMRVALECCLVARLTAEELSQLLPSVYSLPLSEKTIEVYTKYFFEFEQMGRDDWQEYLRLIADDRYTHTRLFLALTRSAEEVLHAVGLPSRMQFGTMLKNIMNTANYRFEYYSRQSGPDAQEEARKWAKVLIEAGVKHEKFGATDATDFSKLIQTQFEYLDPDVPNVTPEMLADAKPQLKAAVEDGLKDAPRPPDTSNQPNDPDNI